MKPLALIPARAGSKRLPGKNLLKLGDRTLVELAVEQAQAAGIFGERIAVTTDDQALLPAAAPTAAAPWWHIERPREIATDDSQMIDAVRHAAGVARDLWRMEFDCVVLLQPTSPLRDVRDVRQCVTMLEGADAVVSVRELDRYPEIYTLGDQSRLRPVSVTDNAYGRPLVVPNGAVYCITTKALDVYCDWWNAQYTRAYAMPASRSIDIDNRADYDLARGIWMRNQS